MVRGSEKFEGQEKIHSLEGAKGNSYASDDICI